MKKQVNIKDKDVELQKYINNKQIYIRGFHSRNLDLIDYLIKLGGCRSEACINGQDSNKYYYIEPMSPDGFCYIKETPINSNLAIFLRKFYKEIILEDSMFVIKHKMNYELYSTQVFPTIEVAIEYLKRCNKNPELFEFIKLDFNYGK